MVDRSDSLRSSGINFSSFQTANFEFVKCRSRTGSINSNAAYHYDKRQSLETLLDWCLYVVWFVFTYVKLLIFKVFMKLCPYSDVLLNIYSKQSQDSAVSLSHSGPTTRYRSLSNVSTLSNSSGISSRKVSVGGWAGPKCDRPCCIDRDDKQYSSIENLVYYQLPFPLNLFPIQLPLSLYRFIVKCAYNFLTVVQYLRSPMTMRKRLRNLFRWRPTSAEELSQAEADIISQINIDFKGYYVNIGPAYNQENVRIWTLDIPPHLSKSNQENEQEGLPLVMMHGFASGSALWCLNLPELNQRGHRHIYAFDMLGFARSDRPRFTFPTVRGMTSLQKSKAEAEFMEKYMVDSIEKWRKRVGEKLNKKFILLGHSFGGYLALAYALRYPEHVAHLILADPWGLPPDSHTRNVSNSHYTSSRQLPTLLRFGAYVFLDLLTPLAGLRAAGPWGPRIINALRPDLKKKFEEFCNSQNAMLSSSEDEVETSISSEEEGKNEDEKKPDTSNIITNYIYHCNAQCPPSGEIAFKKLCTATAWARLPLLERIIELDPNISLSFIYGSRSWIDRQPGYQAKYILATATSNAALRNEASSDSEEEGLERVNVHIMQGSGHHVYADNPAEFNDLVLNICEYIDLQHQNNLSIKNAEPDTYDDHDDDSLEQQQQQQQTAAQQQRSSTVMKNENPRTGGNGGNSTNDNVPFGTSLGLATNSQPLTGPAVVAAKYTNSLPKGAIPEEDSA